MTPKEINKIVFKQFENNETSSLNIPKTPMNNPVHHPKHYQSCIDGLNIECIDAMRAAYGDHVVECFCLGNAMKYLFRCCDKGKNEDIKKAQWYLNKFLQLGGFEDEAGIA